MKGRLAVTRFLKKNAFGLLSVGLSAAILIYAIGWRSNTRDLLTAARDISPVWLLAAITCMLIYWILDGMILHILARLKYKKFGIFKSLSISMTGFVYNALTPFATGGQPMQIADMARKGVRAGDAGSYITMKSILYQGCLTLYAMLSVSITFRFFSHRVSHFTFLVIVGLLLNLLFISVVMLVCLNGKLSAAIAENILRFLARLKIIRQPDKLRDRILKQVELFHHNAASLCRPGRAQGLALVYTAAQLIFLYSIPYCLYRSFHLSGATILYMVAAQAIINMITAFIPMPGASGAAEGSFYLFFTLFFSGLTLLPAIFLWRAITYYSCLLAGGLMKTMEMLKAKPVPASVNQP